MTLSGHPAMTPCTRRHPDGSRYPSRLLPDPRWVRLTQRDGPRMVHHPVRAAHSGHLVGETAGHRRHPTARRSPMPPNAWRPNRTTTTGLSKQRHRAGNYGHGYSPMSRTRFRDPDFSAARLAAEFHLVAFRPAGVGGGRSFAGDGDPPSATGTREHLISLGCSVSHAARGSGLRRPGYLQPRLPPSLRRPAERMGQTGRLSGYSTVTDLARLRGLSTS